MKIFIDEKTGNIFRYFNSSDEIAFTPMTLNGIVDLNDGGIVEWNEENIGDKERIIKALNQ